MSPQAPKISVIVAAYASGDAVRRVIDSLDAQTMPQDEFEVIFVDDGSPDDTYARLQDYAATRPNMHVHTIPNSGWPSRPRNVGVDRARGEYVLFMDHDDSLFPDALRRSYEYAHETGADLLSPKESKTNDAWWGLSSLVDGNVPNALTDGGLRRLLPMVPHKFYRRQVLLDHDIRFPEGSRVLWEDLFINIGVYRHAKVVSVLADTPVYLWHASDSNSSHSFDPARPDYWDRLEDVMEFIVATLDSSEYREARAEALAHQIRVRIIDRTVRMMTKASRPVTQMAFARARNLLGRFASDDVYGLLAKKHAAQAYLMRAGRADLMVDFHRVDLLQQVRVDASKVSWQGGQLALDLSCRWEPKSAGKPVLRRDGDRVVRVVDAELARAIPPELLDVTDDAAAVEFNGCIRARQGHISWNVPVTLRDGDYVEDDAGVLRLMARAQALLDPARGAVGAPLREDVWDFRVKTTWNGMARNGAPLYAGPARPIVRDGQPGVAYANANGAVSVDLGQRLRTLAIDAKPAVGAPAGAIDDFAVPLVNIAADSSGTLDASMIVAIPADAVPDSAADDADSDTEAGYEQLLEKLAADGELNARVVTGEGVARLEGGAALPVGRYVLYARRNGTLHRTTRTLVVDEQRQAQFS